MNIIPDGAEERETKACPTANNTAIPEAAHTPKSIFESCLKNKTKPHGFSKAVADMKNGKQKLGWSAAVVLKYLCFMLRGQGEEYEGKQWVRIKLDHIASQFPYLGRAGVDKAIKRLIKFGACSVKNLNVHFKRRKIDRTRWFHVPKVWMNKAESELRYFYAPLAAVIGVPAAVIHYNFTHWADEQASEGKGQVVSLVPSVQVKLQPFSDKTIDRAIELLKNEHLIHPVPGESCLYSKHPVENTGSKVDDSGSKVDMAGSKVDTIGSKVDNYSYCSSFVDILEECSKTQPSVGSHASALCQEKKHDTTIGLQHIEFLSPFETFVSSAASDEDTAFCREKKHDAAFSVQRPECLSPFNTSAMPSMGCEDNDLPIIEDYNHLHEENTGYSGMVLLLAKESASREMLINKASQLAHEFFRNIGDDFADELYDNATDDELFEALYPLYRSWFSFKSDSQILDILYYGVFECVLGAFWHERHKHQRTHPFACFIPISYDCYLSLSRRADRRIQKAIEQEEAALQKQFASVDADKEWDSSLSPAEKTRVFKQGVYSRNKIGWICLGGERRTDVINIKPGALKDAEKLFVMNPNASAGDLLRVMDCAMKLYAAYPPVKKFSKGNKWHARMAHKLTMFTKHLKTIIKQVGLSEVSPFCTFLNEEGEDTGLIEIEEGGKMAA